MIDDNLDAKVINSFTEKERECLTKADLNRLKYDREDDVEYNINNKLLSEVIGFLSRKADEISNKDAKFYAEYDYDGCIEMEIRYLHTETDEEYKRRLMSKIAWVKDMKSRASKSKKDTEKK